MELFHFIRPLWLLALVPSIILVILLFRSSSSTNTWSKHCDSHLLAHVTIGNDSKSKRSLSVVFIFILWLIAIIALAGPTWSYQKVPVYQQKDTRVIALDVSKSMDTTDVSPTRLEKAKYKIIDILNGIKEGDVGMVVFSSEPFVVSPLTTDSNTIKSMVSSISSGVVPVQGDNIGKALQKSMDLITQSGQSQGTIILVTDSKPNANDMQIAKQIKSKGVSIDVYGIGTPSGGIAKDDSGNYHKDANGHIQSFGIDINLLNELAKNGGGSLVLLTAGNDDVEKLLNISDIDGGIDKSKDMASNTFWRDMGIYFIWVLALCFVFIFRRGVLDKICR